LFELEALALLSPLKSDTKKNTPMAWPPIVLIAEPRTFAGSAIGHARIAD
jgi:hypothetical protein